MDKIELKNLLFLARIGIEDKEHPKILEKLKSTFDLIDEMNELDLNKVPPLNNPLELNNVSRKDSNNDRNSKKDFLKGSPESDEDYFIVPKNYRMNFKLQRENFRSKKISAEEATKTAIDKVKKDNLNIFINHFEEEAITKAKHIDNNFDKFKDLPLSGVPIAHKDIFCTKNLITTCGSKMLKNFVPPYESTVTENCNSAGSIMIAKTNMDEFAMGSSNETSFFGPVSNPWDQNLVPGGSSGGSAACIAADITTISTGTDTGGSIRQPAALCGITGMKPTYGLVSRWGMIAFCSSMDQAGPFARDAFGSAALLDAMASYDLKRFDMFKKKRDLF